MQQAPTLQALSPKNSNSNGSLTIPQVVTALVCATISLGALALNVLAEPSAEEQATQQQDVPKTQIIRGTKAQDGQDNAMQTNHAARQNGAIAPPWLNDLRQAAVENQVAADELAFAISMLAQFGASSSDAVPSSDIDNSATTDWVRGIFSPQTPFAGDDLDDPVSQSLANFFSAQADFAASGAASDTDRQQAASKFVTAAEKAYRDLLQAHAAGKVSADQLVMGLNWILEARTSQADVFGANRLALSIDDIGQTLGRTAEIYRATQAGNNTSSFIKARYYFSRSQELLARLSGNRQVSGVAAKHAMQHALSRYRLVLSTAPLNQQNLFMLTEAAKNRADALMRYAEIRGDASMAARAATELQAAVQMMQAETARRDDTPRNRAVVQMLNALSGGN